MSPFVSSNGFGNVTFRMDSASSLGEGLFGKWAVCWNEFGDCVGVLVVPGCGTLVHTHVG